MISAAVFQQAAERHATYYLTVLRDVAACFETNPSRAQSDFERHYSQIEQSFQFLVQNMPGRPELAQQVVTYALTAHPMLRSWQSIEDALHWIEQGLQALDYCPDSTGYADLLNRQLMDYSVLRPVEMIQDTANRLLDYAERTGDRRARANALFHQGRALARLGEYDASVQALEKAGALYHQLEAMQDYARTLHNLGSVYDIQNKFEQAQHYLEEAIACYRQTDNRRHLVTSLSRLGSVLEQAGNPQTGYTVTQEALQMAYDLKDKQVIAGALLNAAIVAMEAGYHSIYHAYITELVHLSRRIGAKAYLANGLSNLAMDSWLSGDYDDAARYLTEALTYFRQLHARSQISRTVLMLSRIYMMQQRSDEALSYLREGWQLARDINSHYLIVDTLLGLIFWRLIICDDVDSARWWYAACKQVYPDVINRLSAEWIPTLEQQFKQRAPGALHYMPAISPEITGEALCTKADSLLNT
jgi:tetratricopeptide (TPR) repeat protein